MAMIHLNLPLTLLQNASAYQLHEEVMAGQAEANSELLKGHLAQSLYFADEETIAQSENYL